MKKVCSDFLVPMMQYQVQLDQMKNHLENIGVRLPEVISYKQVIESLSNEPIEEYQIVSMLIALEIIFESFEKSFEEITGTNVSIIGQFSPIFLLEDVYNCEHAYDSWCTMKEKTPVPINELLSVLKGVKNVLSRVKKAE